MKQLRRAGDGEIMRYEEIILADLGRRALERPGMVMDFRAVQLALR
jgi:hypothetical protein